MVTLHCPLPSSKRCLITRFSAVDRKGDVVPVLLVLAKYISVARQEQFVHSRFINVFTLGSDGPQRQYHIIHARLRPRIRHIVNSSASN